MTYKTILAVIPSAEVAARVLPAAVALADRFSAHVIGVHVRQLYEIYPGGAGAVNLELYARLRDDAERIAEETREAFDKGTRLIENRTEWREVAAYQSGISQKLCDAALRADLVVMAAPDRDTTNDGIGLMHDLLIGTGRPVLMLPEGTESETIGKRILLAWTPTRESSLATHNALGFLGAAELTTVLTIGNRSAVTTEDATQGHEVARMLARHDVKTEVWHRAQEEASIGAQIVKEAAISGTDLIVMGAFGHNRLHDILFTDATREVMRTCSVPVLFSG